MAFVNPDLVDEILARVEEEYLSEFPELRGKFSIAICKSSDGVKLD